MLSIKRLQSPLRSCALLALLVGVVTLTSSLTAVHAQSSACPAGAISVRPGDNLQSLVDANANGATFCLQPGTYSRVSVVPKDGQVFIGNGTRDQVIFDGTGAIPIAFNGVLQPNNPTANRENVTLRNFTFVNYRSSQPLAQAVIVPDSGWVIENIVIRDSTSGVRGGNINWTCANNFVFRDSLIENISHAALYWNATNGLTERVTVRNSGFSLNNHDSDWYGVVKYQNQGMWSNNSFSNMAACPIEPNKQVIVQDSTFQNLNGVGLWCDMGCQNFVARRNTIRDNQWSGIMFEISGGGTNVFESNTLSCNRRGTRYVNGAWGGGEFFIANAFGMTIRNNDITVCDGGRAFSFVFENWRTVPTRDIAIENNIVRMQANPAYTSGNDPQRNVLTVTYLENGNNGRNIAFRSNRYFVNDVNADYFHWASRNNWSRWQPLVQDTGTFQSLTGAPGPLPQPTQVAQQPTATAISPTATPNTPLASPTPAQAHPFRGTPIAIPGTVQAEDFDLGGRNIGFSDTTTGNEGGQVYRTDAHDVDLKQTPAGVVVGWYTNSDWMQYTVNVAQAGAYDLTIVSGAVDAGRTLTMTMNGQAIASNVPVPQIATWDTALGSVTVRGINLNAGTQVLRIAAAQGFLDLDSVTFARSAQATPVPPTATTIAPTVVPPTLPPTATPVPTQLGLRAVTSKPSYLVGEVVVVNFNLENTSQIPNGARAFEATCQTTPIGIVVGQTIALGSLFGPAPVTINPGFRPDGSFTFAISQTNQNPSVTTAGTVFSISNTALTAGSAQIACQVRVIDGNRVEQALTFIPATITVGTVVAQQPTATLVAPTLVPPTATIIPPTATLVPPTATPVPPTATLVPPTATIVMPPTATPTSAPQFGEITGTVQRSHAASDAGITISVIANGNNVATATTLEDGTFRVNNVPAGSYTIRAEALGYLPAEGVVTVTAGAVTQKSAVTILAGYIVVKAVPAIDELDVVQLAVEYGRTENGTPLAADLDEDGRVELGDLTALAENLRVTGAIPWN
jgi:hypothetical protein